MTVHNYLKTCARKEYDSIAHTLKTSTQKQVSCISQKDSLSFLSFVQSIPLFEPNHDKFEWHIDQKHVGSIVDEFYIPKILGVLKDNFKLMDYVKIDILQKYFNEKLSCIYKSAACSKPSSCSLFSLIYETLVLKLASEQIFEQALTFLDFNQDYTLVQPQDPDHVDQIDDKTELKSSDVITWDDVKQFLKTRFPMEHFERA